MLARMLDQPVGQIIQAIQMRVAVVHCFGQALVALRFDLRCSVFHALLHKSHQLRPVRDFQVLGIIRIARLLSLRGIGEVIHCRGSMDHVGKESPGFGLRLELIFVFGEVAGHGDELSPDIVPLLEHGLRGTGCRSRLLLLGFLSPKRNHQKTRSKQGNANHHSFHCFSPLIWATLTPMFRRSGPREVSPGL